MNVYFIDEPQFAVSQIQPGDIIKNDEDSYVVGQRGRRPSWIQPYSNKLPARAYSTPKAEKKPVVAPTPDGFLDINPAEGVFGIKMSMDRAIAYLCDGRAFSPAAQAIFENLGYTSGKTNDNFDLVKNENKYELRTITPALSMADFRPSNQIGKGRATDVQAVLDKWNSIYGYIFVDVSEAAIRNGRIPYYVVTTEKASEWYNLGELGKNMQLSKKKLYKLLSEG